MPNLKNSEIVKFEQSRKVPKNAPICFAPSLSLNFEQNGNVTACCFNRVYVLGTFPKHSLQEIWTGQKIAELRSALDRKDLSLGCQSCSKMILEGNYESVLIKHFDDFHHLLETKSNDGLFSRMPFLKSKTIQKELTGPKVLEFELSNVCNLECIMCGGKWSSSIRKNREQLEPLEFPYNDEFVAQLKDFIPNLERVNFLGGEPFLIQIYFKIWEELIKLNPGVTVAITSNGTILNQRVKNIIAQLDNCKITLSIDSLKKITWEKIRLKGNFDKLQENMNWFLESGKLVSFSVCPMIQNWKEIPEIVSFCIGHNLDIYFNIVYGPLGGRIKGIHESQESLSYKIPETSLQLLDSKELTTIILFYKKHSFKGRQGVQFENLINQLENWLKEKKE